MRDGPIITVDGFFVEALQYIMQYAPELPNIIREGLKYLSKKLSNVGNRPYSAPDYANKLQEYEKLWNRNDRDTREDYIYKSVTTKHRRPFHSSKMLGTC